MESLITSSETFSQFRKLPDGMVLICQDVNELKRGDTTQCNPSWEADDNGMLDETADGSPQLAFTKKISGANRCSSRR